MLTSQQCLKKFGTPGDVKTEGRFMSPWDIPVAINIAIPTLPNLLYCNNLIRAPLELAFRNVIARKLTGQIRTFDGCYKVRNKTGQKSLSLHCWGVAVDINAAWNRYNAKPTMSPELVKCFTDAGFDWGGTWSKPDGMHFQLKTV